MIKDLPLFRHLTRTFVWLAVGVAGLCTAYAVDDVRLKKETITYTNTEYYPEASRNNYVLEQEYDDKGYVTKSTATMGDEEKSVYNTTNEYADYNDTYNLWETKLTKIEYPDYSQAVYHLYRFDKDGNHLSTIDMSAGSTEMYYARVYEWIKDTDGVFLLSSIESYEETGASDPYNLSFSNLTELEKVVWCEGAGKYLSDLTSPTVERRVYPDSVTETRWRDASRSQLESIKVDYYNGGKKVGYKNKDFRDNYDESEAKWYGRMDDEEVVDSINKTITDLYYNMNDAGEFYAYRKYVKTFNYGEPGGNSYYYIYNRNSKDEEWVMSSDSRNCKWKASAKILEYYNAESGELFSEVKYDDDLNKVGTITRVDESLYYATLGGIFDDVKYVTYYNSSNQLARKLRISTRENLFYPIIREWVNGQWIAPTQSFYLKNYMRMVDHPAGNSSGWSEITWNAKKDYPKQETYYIIKDNGQRENIRYRQWLDEEDGFRTLESTYDGYNSSWRTSEEATLKNVTDDVLGFTLKLSPKNSKDTYSYSEYDRKRRLLHNYYYDESLKQYIYSSTDCKGKYDYDNLKNDTTYRCSRNYNRNSDLLSGNLTKEVKTDSVRYLEEYNLHPTEGTWILQKQTTEEYTERPDWIHFNLPAGIDINNGIPSFIGVSKSTLKRKDPRSVSSTSKQRDVHSVVKTYDELTGDPISTTVKQVEYTNDQYLCERRVVEVVDGANTEILRERYEKNGHGLPVAIFKDDQESRYYYNSNNLLLKAEVGGYQPAVYTFSYYGESDVIDESGVEAVRDQDRILFFINGNTIRTIDAPEFTVYSIDGRVEAKTSTGVASVNGKGIYILQVGSRTAKVRIR